MKGGGEEVPLQKMNARKCIVCEIYLNVCIFKIIYLQNYQNHFRIRNIAERVPEKRTNVGRCIVFEI